MPEVLSKFLTNLESDKIRQRSQRKAPVSSSQRKPFPGFVLRITLGNKSDFAKETFFILSSRQSRNLALREETSDF
ncbi:MAG: hypothetical protein OM95_16650 [Bdellovibrio sp. ArHS]|nr:MAG: hypothetical protein OM95_16650 [Bdellovibrio sp. ArHS]